MPWSDAFEKEISARVKYLIFNFTNPPLPPTARVNFLDIGTNTADDMKKNIPVGNTSNRLKHNLNSLPRFQITVLLQIK